MQKTVTLKQISTLLDRKLDLKLAPIQHQLTNLLGETTYTRNEVEKLRSEMNLRFFEVDKRFDEVDKKFKNVDKRFDFVDTQFQNVLQAASDITDQKLEKFRQKYIVA